MRRVITGLLPLAYMLLVIHLPGCKGKDLNKQLDRYLSEARWEWGFHGSALVAYDGQVILSSGYGMANRDFGELNTPQTKFFIGSITKQFTAAAILLLHQQGKLQLDDPISRHLQQYPKPVGDLVTIRHLLTHTAGLPDYSVNPEIFLNRTAPVSSAALLESFWRRPLEFEPGAAFRYSNSGYIVLGAIIETVSGQSYEAFLHHWIFGPLGMHNSGYARREAGLPDRADGYTTDEDLRPHAAAPIHYSVLHSAGALYSTVADLLKWDRALAQGTVISPASVEAMLTPQVDGYGYGVVIDSLFGRRHVYHGGYLDGFNSTFERWPDQKLCVIVLSNDDMAPVKKIAHGLAAIAFGEPHDFPIRREAAPMDREVLKEYQAVFDLGDGRFRHVLLEGDTLHTWTSGEPRTHLLPMAIDTFFFETDNTVRMTFLRDDSGRVRSIDLTDEGITYRAPRVAADLERELLLRWRPIQIDPSLYEEYIGIYQLETDLVGDADGFALVVTRRGDRLFVTGTYTEDVELFPRTEADFFHQTADFELTFVRNESAQVIGCIVRMAGAEISGRKVR